MVRERLGTPGLVHKQMCHTQKLKFCKNEADKHALEQVLETHALEQVLNWGCTKK